MPETIAPYHERLPELERELTERGSLGVLVLDASSLATIEDAYGTLAYEEVRQKIAKILDEARGAKEGGYRQGDILCLDRPRGLRFLFLLDRKRRRTVPLSVADLRTARARLVSALVEKLSRAAYPWWAKKSAPPLDVGHSLAVYNPLLHPVRMVERAVQEALSQAAQLRRAEEQLKLEQLQDILLRERVVTAYQAIHRLHPEELPGGQTAAEGTVMGFEALSRGVRGSGLEKADDLFEAARTHGLRVELDRLCRTRALLSTGRIPSNVKVFVNTLPATMRDPQFRDRALIDFLARAQIRPERIVIEITEQEVIENHAIFRGTMEDFKALGMLFAVDDVGAGYSGIDTIAKLGPDYLKVDYSLVHDVQHSKANRAMVKAIIDLAKSIRAKVIAEGIEKPEEVQTLRALGVDFGQGYHLAPPQAGPEPT